MRMYDHVRSDTAARTVGAVIAWERMPSKQRLQCPCNSSSVDIARTDLFDDGTDRSRQQRRVSLQMNYHNGRLRVRSQA